MELMKRPIVFALMALCVWMTISMTGGMSAAAEPTRQIYVTNHGFHTGIVLPLRDFDPQRTLGTAYFNNRNWIEIGWGDAAFYQASGEDYWLGAKALFTPTEAIMHVHAFLAPPPDRFSASEIVGVKLTEVGYRRMIARIRATFTRGKDGRAVPVNRGLYGVSYFYKAEGTYSIFYTCNSWTADVLADAGVDIDPGASKRASSVMEQLREVGE
ncbi:MAG: hypothetical protein CMM48_01115 [Rhodospirillaceae bacterium]|nr:hypothetical protein [Rhodospirillaceae bacterium]